MARDLNPISCPRCGCLASAHHGPTNTCEGVGGNCGCRLSRWQAEAEYEEGRIAGADSKPSTEEQQSLHRAVDLAARLSDLLQEMKLGFIEDSYSHNKTSIEDKQKFIAAVEHTVQHGAIQMFMIADLQYQFYSEKKWLNDMMESLTIFEMARAVSEHIQKAAADWLIRGEGGGE